MISLYGSGQARSFRALWALEEAGLDFEYQQSELVSLIKVVAVTPLRVDINPCTTSPNINSSGLSVNACNNTMISRCRNV